MVHGDLANQYFTNIEIIYPIRIMIHKIHLYDLKCYLLFLVVVFFFSLLTGEIDFVIVLPSIS
jgi:hypothetical protein